MADSMNPSSPETSPENGNVVRVSTFCDLPDRCLINIFKWLPLQNMDNIIELSPKYDKLIQEHIPVEVHLTDIGFRLAMHYFIGFEDLSKYRIKVVHSRVLDEPLPKFKSPEDLQILEFATHTEMATFQSLLAGAVNLQELLFGFSSLCGQPLCHVDFHLQNLKIVQICDRVIEFKEVDNHDILPQNILGFMRKSYPSIEVFSLTTSANKMQTIEYSKELLKFIQRHAGTLKKLKFKISTSLKKEQSESGIRDLEELPNPEEFDLSLLASVKLEDLELNFGDNFFVGLEQWIWILTHQTSMAFLKLGVEHHFSPSFYTAPIAESASMLKSVHLGVEVFNKDTNQRSEFDCSVFENCHNLKMIVLIGTSHPELRSPCPEMVKLTRLPKSLACLAVENMFLETCQLAVITQNLLRKTISLEKLSLRNIGIEGDFGVTLTILDTWISSQLLKEIIIKGINGNDTKLHEYEHLSRIGVKLPIAKCLVHAVFSQKSMEYRKPCEEFR